MPTPTDLDAETRNQLAELTATGWKATQLAERYDLTVTFVRQLQKDPSFRELVARYDADNFGKARDVARNQMNEILPLMMRKHIEVALEDGPRGDKAREFLINKIIPTLAQVDQNTNLNLGGDMVDQVARILQTLEEEKGERRDAIRGNPYVKEGAAALPQAALAIDNEGADLSTLVGEEEDESPRH